MTEADRSDEARMAWYMASQIRDGEVAFVGIGIPGLAAMVAKRAHAPGLSMVFESGVMGANPDRLPLSTGSPAVARNAALHGSMLDVFSLLQQGRVDVGLLSGAQVDRHGNLNTTTIGPHRKPAVRLPGSGGAHDIAVLAQRVIIVMPHETKRFVPQVSFVTSPGHMSQSERRRLGIRGAGPAALVTSRALFSFDDGEMTLAALGEGETADSAVAGISWDVKRRAVLDMLPPFPADARQRFPFLFGAQD